MTGLISECEKYFHCNDLYNVLGVKRDCKPEELRKAFYKMSLLHHPDRQAESAKEAATIRFQTLSKVYSLLSDHDKRAIYDESGVVDDEDVLSSKTYDDWVKYWELLFPRITTKQIDEYRAKYRDSEEELNDLVEIYQRSNGNMDVILESLLFSSDSDEKRIRHLIDGLIKEGRVEAYDQYVNESPTKAAKRAKRALKEKKLFERDQRRAKKRKSEQTVDESSESLCKAILENRTKRAESLLDHLTKKYCNNTEPIKRKTSLPYSVFLVAGFHCPFSGLSQLLKHPQP
ncbi:unnamed protein product [Calicophoron daubneyi]|uniref:J domain-containing protein n=1 Tax=Calicophoron daubneyi TaxID=300641 RepID=A0AAV2TFT9_CALDB